MFTPKKIIGVVLAVVLVAAAVVGVAYASAQYEEKGQAPGLRVAGKLVEDPGTIMTVGEEEISFTDYRYYYMMNMSYMTMYYGEEFWKTDYDGSVALQLRQSTDTSIQEMYAWMEYAKQNEISLSDEEKEEVQTTLQSQKDTLGDEFQANLESMYFTDEAMYVRVTEMQKLAQKAEAQAEEKLEATLGDFEPSTEGLLTAKHILIAIDEEAEDPVAEEEAAMAQAQDIVDQLREEEAKEDGDVDALFTKLLEEYGEDPGMETNPNGYTFKEGDMVDEFYQGTMELKEGEISEPVASDFGYHIIYRLPLDEAYLAENADSMKEEEVHALLDEEIAAIKESMPIGYGTYYQDIKPENMS